MTKGAVHADPYTSLKQVGVQPRHLGCQHDTAIFIAVKNKWLDFIATVHLRKRCFEEVRTKCQQCTNVLWRWSLHVVLVKFQWVLVLCLCLQCFGCLQCFDAVGWAAGRASGRSKTGWCSAGMVICLEQGADLHMAQLMPLPLTVSCFSKIQIGFTFWYRLTCVVPEKGR